MGDEVRGWSNRKKTFTVGGTLGALASLVTIVSFFTAHSGTPAPGPTGSPFPNLAGYSADSTAPAQVATTSSGSTASSQYPASAQRAIVNDFLQGSPGLPVSVAQCELNWLEANVPYTTFEQDPVVYEGQADTSAPCVPP